MNKERFESLLFYNITTTFNFTVQISKRGQKKPMNFAKGVKTQLISGN